MKSWPSCPVIYECLGLASGIEPEKQRPDDFAEVPGEVWDSIADLKFDAVWLMGVWERSPAGMAIAN
jgi:hypothetical protein